MTGSTLAAILIPPAGTIFLVAWLAVVFYAGRDHPPRAGRNPAPGRQSPGTAAPASRRQADARPPDRGRVAMTAARSAATHAATDTGELARGTWTRLGGPGETRC